MSFRIKLLFIGLLLPISAFSQDDRSMKKSGVNNILNAENPEDIGIRTSSQISEDKNDPLKYGFVDEKDVLWSTIVWEIIDLNQRVNFPLLYPTDLEIVGDERRPMLWWLRQEIEAKKIPVYDANSTQGNFINRVKDEDIPNIFATYDYMNDADVEYLEYPVQTVRDSLDTQISTLGFNPYTLSLEDPKRAEFENNPDNIVLFPYEIEDNAVVRNAGIDVITYEDFNDFEENEMDYPTKVRTGYYQAITEQIEKKLFIEGTHFQYVQVQYDEIVQYLIKGMWYFDKRLSELIYRPIGIAPVRTSILDAEEGGDDSLDFDPIADLRGEDQDDTDNDGVGDDIEGDYDTNPNIADTDGDGVNDNFEILLADELDDEELATNPDNKPTQEQIDQFFEDLNNPDEPEEDAEVALDNKYAMFWVYYPHAREILKKGQAFNNRNLSQSVSFDDIINSRRFHSIIFREENVYENREIKSYINKNSFMRLLESERIKEKIRNFEHDMWSW